MDNVRLILILALGAVLFLIYQAWVQDYGQQRPTPASVESPATTDGAPRDTAALPADAPDAPPATAPTEAMQAGADTAGAETAIASTPIIVETDLVRAEISPIGGTITNLWLKDYAQTADDGSERFRLLKPEPPNFFIAQSGLFGDAASDLPTHNSVFTAEQPEYRLAEDQDVLHVELR
jgi:YidC/Oxa1 family membrane protein insertase